MTFHIAETDATTFRCGRAAERGTILPPGLVRVINRLWARDPRPCRRCYLALIDEYNAVVEEHSDMADRLTEIDETVNEPSHLCHGLCLAEKVRATLRRSGPARRA